MKAPIAIVHDNPEHSALTYIDWNLSTLCNYACSYCPERLHSGLLKGIRSGSGASFLRATDQSLSWSWTLNIFQIYRRRAYALQEPHCSDAQDQGVGRQCRTELQR